MTRLEKSRMLLNELEDSIAGEDQPETKKLLQALFLLLEQQEEIVDTLNNAAREFGALS